MSKELYVLMDNRRMGRVRQGDNGKLSFVYDEQWRNSETSYPLSLSMPLALSEHPHHKIDAFLWGLLPDNEGTLNRLGRDHHVSPRSAFALISVVGEDCAGAEQFIRPERLDALNAAAPADIQWLTEKEIAERLRILRGNYAAGRLPSDEGQFSLAGAQPKTAFLFEGGKWGVPSGRIPTTRILKPPTDEFEGHAENEHYCLQLARALGLTVPDSQILTFEGQIAIVVDRYDRIQIDGIWHRVHQEDTRQGLGFPPTKKYQNEGGPSAADIVSMLRDYSRTPAADVQTFVEALAFNWLIAGTDGHSKNYSVLIGAGGNVRLAPLYDLASILPYADKGLHKVKLAMKLGGEYLIREIRLYHWKKMAAELRLDTDQLVQRVDSFAEQLPELANKIHQQLEKEGLKHHILTRLAETITERSKLCRKILGTV
jgi:serine/threonine-protein kinase HipA